MKLTIPIGEYTITTPSRIQSPKRMYIVIPGLKKDDLKDGFDIHTARIDGNPIEGYNKVIALVQTENGLRVSLGGDA